MNVEVYLPAVTAALTLCNTIVLWWVSQRTAEIRRHVNGMKLQLVQDAEERGRRLERHVPRETPIGE